MLIAKRAPVRAAGIAAASIDAYGLVTLSHGPAQYIQVHFTLHLPMSPNNESH